MRKNNCGWYVEVPIELKEEFEQCYKGRSAKRKLTIAAIKWAIQVRPDLMPVTPPSLKENISED